MYVRGIEVCVCAHVVCVHVVYACGVCVRVEVCECGVCVVCVCGVCVVCVCA